MSDTSDQIVESWDRAKSSPRAVHLLSEKRGITEDAALDMLVRLSGDADATVRETAGRICCRTRRTVEPRSTLTPTHPQTTRPSNPPPTFLFGRSCR
jgi:hypothetical protein